MDIQMIESHGSFAIDYIKAVSDALNNGDSKEALRCINWAQEKLEAMRKELGFVGY